MTANTREKMSSVHKPGQRTGADKIATGKYICDMLLELRNLSNRSDLTFLTQLLEMTYNEAFMVANRIEPPKAELEEVARVIARAAEWERAKRA